MVPGVLVGGFPGGFTAAVFPFEGFAAAVSLSGGFWSTSGVVLAFLAGAPSSLMILFRAACFFFAMFWLVCVLTLEMSESQNGLQVGPKLDTNHEKNTKILKRDLGVIRRD
jgi:hypothetical protein